MPKPLVSIAICTHNRCDLLREALNAFLVQTVSSNIFEIIIINNASNDNTEDIIQEFSIRFPFFKSIYEQKLGLSHARNTALKCATTDWICFIDDDAKAASDYIEVVLRIIEKNIFKMFGGAFLPWRRDPLPSWFLDEYEETELSKLSQVTQLPTYSYVTGCNMVIHKSLLTTIGTFNTKLGMVGKELGYGEETEFQMRVHAAGYKIGYIPDLIVQHYVRPEKSTFTARCKIYYHAGISHQKASGEYTVFKLFFLVLRLIASPVKGVFIGIKRLCSKTYHWQNALLEVVGRFLYRIGNIVAWFCIYKRN